MVENNQNELDNIDFDKLLQESRNLVEMINQNDILGNKLNEILKMFVNVIHIQNEKIEKANMTATDYKNKYESLLKEHEELKHDYDVIYDLYERKKELLQIIEDNEDD